MAIEFIVLNLNNSVLFQNPLPNITARGCKLKRASLSYLLHNHHIIITPDTLGQFITIKSNTPHINGSNKIKLRNDMSSGKVTNKKTSPSVNIAVQANPSKVIEESPKAVTKIKVVGDSHARGFAKLIQEKTEMVADELVYPGAKLGEVFSFAKEAYLSTFDYLVITAGANDAYSGKAINVLKT